MLEIETDEINAAKIKVLGVGGAGCNAVNSMIDAGVRGVDFICVNTDKQALDKCKSEIKIQIGEKLTRGLGAGSNPRIGQEAAEETIDEIKQLLEGTDMLFITAGMGGGTGTGAAPVIASAAKEMGILTIGVVTKPFTWEGPKKMEKAKLGISYLENGVDSLIVVPNAKLVENCNKNTTFIEALQMSNNVLKQGVQGISEIVSEYAILNVDFADVRKTLSDSGIAHIGVGTAKGENRAQVAVEAALNSPLLETKIDGARDIIYAVRAGYDFNMAEAEETANRIREVADPNADLKLGVIIDENMTNEISVVIIATGFGGYGVDGKGTLVNNEPQKIEVDGMVATEVTLQDLLKASSEDDGVDRFETPDFI